jgi:hypothetical protein
MPCWKCDDKGEKGEEEKAEYSEWEERHSSSGRLRDQCTDGHSVWELVRHASGTTLRVIECDQFEIGVTSHLSIRAVHQYHKFTHHVLNLFFVRLA